MLIKLSEYNFRWIEVSQEELDEVLESDDPAGYWDTYWSDLNTDEMAVEDEDGNLLWTNWRGNKKT